MENHSIYLHEPNTFDIHFEQLIEEIQNITPVRIHNKQLVFRINQWINKLQCEPARLDSWKKNRNLYAALLKGQITRDRLEKPFDKLPDFNSQLPTLPRYYTIYIDQKDLQILNLNSLANGRRKNKQVVPPTTFIKTQIPVHIEDDTIARKGIYEEPEEPLDIDSSQYSTLYAPSTQQNNFINGEYRKSVTFNSPIILSQHSPQTIFNPSPQMTTPYQQQELQDETNNSFLSPKRQSPNSQLQYLKKLETLYEEEKKKRKEIEEGNEKFINYLHDYEIRLNTLLNAFKL